MPYIGARPVVEFSTIPSKDSFTGDGSTTTFDLATEIATGGENALEVFINNVRQEPGSGKAFTLGPDGSNNTKRITFTAAPASGAAIYVINDKTNYMTLLNPKDLNGVELILDVDGDTSITADSDDQIDFKIAGVEHISITNSSGDTVIKPRVDAKDIVFQQYDGNKILEINDGNYVAISGAAAGPGELRFYEDTDNGVLYTGFKAGNVTSSVSYVLPLADGTDGYQLTTDGSGTLSWAAAQFALANDGNNRIVTGTGSATLNAEANLTFDGSVLAATGNITATGTMEPAGDTAASDNAAIGYTSAEGLILTGQGSTNDITIKNDADADVISIPTGTTGVTLAGTLGVGAITGTSTIQGTTITATTAFVPDASDGAALGTAALEFSDLFLADSAVLNFGDDQDTTLTHTDGTGLTLNSTNKICFNDTSQFIQGASNAILALGATDEIDLTATLVDINANVEISGTATTTGVHTFSAVPVLPANSIDSAHYVDGSIDTAHIAADNITSALIADDAIDSEHYTDGSIDNAHIADNAIDSEHYADGSIDNAHIADDQIDSEHYADGSIDNAHIADDQIDSEHYVDGSIDTAHIADDQITLAKMASGTDGNLITYDASGNPAAVATGNDGQVLTSAGAGQPPVFETSSGISMGKAIAAAIVFG